jgi:hypothetical protein
MPAQPDKWWQANAVALGQIVAGTLLICVNVGLWIAAALYPQLESVSTRMDGSMLGVGIGILIIGNGFKDLRQYAIDQKKLNELKRQTFATEETVRQGETMIVQGEMAAKELVAKADEVAQVAAERAVAKLTESREVPSNKGRA